MDVSNLISGYKIQLEKKALQQFGAEIGNFVKQGTSDSLSQLSNPDVSSIRTNNQQILNKTSTNNGPGSGNGVWEPVKYADDLISFAPKHRFIFKVKFIFNEPYSRINREFMYVVKQIDKPKVTFEYEDINMYNFRTKVLKAIRHESLMMAFHDDIQNRVLDFFNAYRVAYSPISRLSYNQKNIFEDSGMDFYSPDSNSGINSSSLGLLANGNINILSHIELIQVYAHGTRQNTFIFTNPRIENFDFDNLDHGSSEGNALTVNFNYDALYIKDDISVGTPEPRWGASDILGNKENGPRNKFSNMTIGGDDTRVKSSIPSVTNKYLNQTGTSLNAITSAFPKSLTNIVSSDYSFNSSTKTTIASALPNITNATSKLIRNFGFGDSDIDVELKNINNEGIDTIG
jgi:hypothetical protein